MTRTTNLPGHPSAPKHPKPSFDLSYKHAHSPPPARFTNSFLSGGPEASRRRRFHQEYSRFHPDISPGAACVYSQSAPGNCSLSPWQAFPPLKRSADAGGEGAGAFSFHFQSGIALPTRPCSHSVMEDLDSGLLPRQQRLKNAYVGVFRHAPSTRGFKDMLWEPSFCTIQPVLTQMDIARQQRFAARHVHEQELDLLPVHTFGECGSETVASTQELGGLPLCVICIEGLRPNEKVRRLPCRHVFHKRCIDLWLRGVCSWEVCFTRSCPTCKQPLDFTAMQPLGSSLPSKTQEGGGSGGEQGQGQGRTFMSRLGDAIPSWAYARAGAALLQTESNRIPVSKTTSGKCLGGGGKPPCAIGLDRRIPLLCQ